MEFMGLRINLISCNPVITTIIKTFHPGVNRELHIGGSATSYVVKWYNCGPFLKKSVFNNISIEIFPEGIYNNVIL